MIYEIQSKSDFLTGATLIVLMPENDLDKKALYTIQADKPDFILPFHYRNVDGQVEIIYQIGAHSKLQYLSGARSPKEYATLWSGLLTPLLNCADWFMKPYSFVLNAEYLFYDKNNNAVSYVYIPSIRDCSEHSAIKEMAVEFSRHITVADADLENKVLRTIMKNFDPKEFLQMLELYITVNTPTVAAATAAEPIAVDEPEMMDSKQADISVPELSPNEPQESASGVSGDIIIKIPAGGKSVKKEKAGIIDGKFVRYKKEKEPKKSGNKGRLFGGKTDARQELIAGNTSETQPVSEPVHSAAPVYAPLADSNDVTQNVSTETNGSRLRLVGSVLLPPIIDIRLSAGEIFTIGRFDAVVGIQQSNFEFDKKTKAVSRRHAAIERDTDRYRIVDLYSSAGTFIDGQKLPPNTPCELDRGCRVSFGNAGADYVWEE